MIVKQAVEAHGGAVRINNRPGDGCSFVVDLPLTQGNGIPEDEETERVGAGR
jgi:signal transduction histidine kinase